MCTNETQLKALFDSINLWERRFATNDINELNLLFSLPCPLCILNTAPSLKVDCTSCIIATETGKHGCSATPYHDAIKAKIVWKQAVRYGESLASCMIYQALWRVEAMKMIKLLKSLVPRDAWLWSAKLKRA